MKLTNTMSKKLKVGVVGVGYLGRFHALIYSRMENVELVGVPDTDPAQAGGRYPRSAPGSTG